MNQNNILQAFEALKKVLQSFNNETQEELLIRIGNQNQWFTEKSVLKAVNGIVTLLEAKTLEKATSSYYDGKDKLIGVIAAGNIPAVGFADVLYVLLTGNRVAIKLSSKDEFLMRFLFDALINIDPDFKSLILDVEKLSLKELDAVIATGSSNTARYFENYFKDIPHVIRKNRTSVAVLSGDESESELMSLANDVTQYFGLGCRNVTKFYVPEGYDFIPFLRLVEDNFKELIFLPKYNNNYDYYKAVYLVDSKKHLDNGILLLREEESLFSPVAVLHYATYKELSEVKKELDELQEKIQTVVSKTDIFERQIPFGEAQCSTLFDFPDGENIFEFIKNL